MFERRGKRRVNQAMTGVRRNIITEKKVECGAEPTDDVVGVVKEATSPAEETRSRKEKYVAAVDHN